MVPAPSSPLLTLPQLRSHPLVQGVDFGTSGPPSHRLHGLTFSEVEHWTHCPNKYRISSAAPRKGPSTSNNPAPALTFSTPQAAYSRSNALSAWQRTVSPKETPSANEPGTCMVNLGSAALVNPDAPAL